MAIDAVRQHFKKWNRDGDILEFEESSATVELAARALGVEQVRIAKTISLKDGDSAILLVVAGDARIQNSKFKAEFKFKPRMLTAEDVLAFTGHMVGGVCPFGLKNALPVYLDVSLRRFKTVFPAAGSGNSAIELTCEQLEECSGSKKWIDVCGGWE